jgi:hypothetical protein
MDQFFELFSLQLTNFSSLNLPLYIFGDFNIDILKFRINYNAKRYVDMFISLGLLQFINKPTRCTPNSATLIDHFLSNKVEDETKTGILTVKISDHFPIFYAAKCNKHVDQIKYLQVRDFSKRNIDSLKRTCHKLDGIMYMNV